MKHREFWVTQDGFCTVPKRHTAYAGHPNYWDGLPLIHVIEKQAYDELKTENVNLYSDLNSMGDSIIILTQQRDNALKMLEEMAEALEFYESCHICSRCNPALKSKALEKYRKSKEGMK